MGRLRASFRLARVGVHLCAGFAIAALVYPTLSHARRLRTTQRWSRRLLSILGVELIREGAPPSRCALIVANHISWLDVFAINAVVSSAFVCKDDVRSWPLIGWLCARSDTIFIRRGSSTAAKAAAAAVAESLNRGRVVALFPEGTSSEGAAVLPFRAALLQAAVDTGSHVRPVALRYVDAHGRRCEAAAYCGTIRFATSLWAIAAAQSIRIELAFLPPLAADGCDRRSLAAQAHRAIAQRLDGQHSSMPEPALAATPVAATA